MVKLASEVVETLRPSLLAAWLYPSMMTNGMDGLTAHAPQSTVTFKAGTSLGEMTCCVVVPVVLVWLVLAQPETTIAMDAKRGPK